MPKRKLENSSVVDEHDLRFQAAKALDKIRDKYTTFATSPAIRMHRGDLDEFHSIIKRCSHDLVTTPFSIGVQHHFPFGVGFDWHTSVYRFEHGLIDMLYMFFADTEGHKLPGFSFYIDEVLAILDTFKSKHADVCVPSMQYLIEHYVKSDVTVKSNVPHPHASENIHLLARYCKSAAIWKLASARIFTKWLMSIYRNREHEHGRKPIDLLWRRPMIVLFAQAPGLSWEDIRQHIHSLYVYRNDHPIYTDLKPIFDEFLTLQKNTVRKVQKVLWHRVQQRNQRHAMHELHKPGGLATQQTARFWANPELRNKHEKYLASLRF